MVGSDLHAAAPSLYNGNISRMTTALPYDRLGQQPASNAPAALLGRAFRYDQLDRIRFTEAFVNFSGGQWQNTGYSAPGLATLPVGGMHGRRWGAHYQYDPNGNIESLWRNGPGGVLMDNLTYDYNAFDNRLNFVGDGVAAGDFPDDIDGQSAGNYVYDASGRLVSNADEAVERIEWTSASKPASVVKGTGAQLAFDYGAGGSRWFKSDGETETYYARDASGNVLSVYTFRLAASTVTPATTLEDLANAIYTNAYGGDCGAFVRDVLGRAHFAEWEDLESEDCADFGTVGGAIVNAAQNAGVSDRALAAASRRYFIPVISFQYTPVESINCRGKAPRTPFKGALGARERSLRK